jgi:hypothetical protein
VNTHHDDWWSRVLCAGGQVQELERTALQGVYQQVYGNFNDTTVLTEFVGLEI